MIIYYNADLKTESLDGIVIEWIEFDLKDSSIGETIVVDWERGEYTNGEGCKASGRLKNVMFNPFEGDFYYADGCLDKVLNFDSIYAFQWRYFDGDDIYESGGLEDSEVKITSLEFYDGNSELIFDIVDSKLIRR